MLDLYGMGRLPDRVIEIVGIDGWVGEARDNNRIIHLVNLVNPVTT